MSLGFGLWHRYVLCDHARLLIFLLLLAILGNVSLIVLLFASLFRFLGGCGFGLHRLIQGEVLVLACVDLPGQALDSPDIVKAESSHLLAHLLHLLNAR